MTASQLPPPPRSTANPAPIRPADSVRRTSSIDVCWPDGLDGERLFFGRARDLVTPATGGAGQVCAEGSFEARIGDDKTIRTILAEPGYPKIGQLVGERGGGHLRMVLAERMPELIAAYDPLYLTLDDISGTALVSAFARWQWEPELMARHREQVGEVAYRKQLEQRVNICWGLKEGHSGVSPEGPPYAVADADAGHLRNPADPEGWHAFPQAPGPGFRRARRIDVMRDRAAGVIRIDSAFQDSAKLKQGGRVAIHEYNLRVTVDTGALEILSIEPEARILPFSECPGAIANAQRLVGKRIGDMRDEVLSMLRGPAGCTHLNDALRALADIPGLVARLPQEA
ncbi:DUF2889 domain-containing protein [Novosphingobium mathurense]|uniref:DUF2889 domain-containing protein n=1 Tax=Novosphingobium mathurense TaxID=428990 RepID=A0A1U6IFL7_9SPHN|nr:DUF2889 domain-containing protein [Novosphingobium mathurense]SLK06790.1 Protein of unknown function [Novosphingobium mathurense]